MLKINADKSKLLRKIPLIIYLHIIMMYLSARTSELFFLSGLDGRVGEKVFLVMSVIYSICFIIGFIRTDNINWFYCTVFALSLFYLLLCAKGEIDVNNGIIREESGWPFVVLFLCFPAWPFLGLPHFLNSWQCANMPWTMVLIIYLGVFCAVLFLKYRNHRKYIG